MVILWALGGLVGGVVVLLVVLTLTHMGTDQPTETTELPSPTAPAQPQSCYPFAC
ncbi:hypothetical protein [Nocardia aurea]|uniref:Uncharacterized protein n=1 Tax=Nocardia aurea TaxID=2144174 RepID=A0ABV3G534_9NOCA